jgi:putative hydrolase
VTGSAAPDRATPLDADALARQDMHVHSRFSDGADTIEDNVAEAESIGLRELTCVDHVRAGTDWVPDYAAAVARVAAGTPLRLRCGIEAKLLDTTGALDLPRGDRDGVDWIFAADHQVPLAGGPANPRDVREQLAGGALAAADVLDAIVTATGKAAARHPGVVVIAHLFSVLPKIGLDEADVPAPMVDALAAVAAASGARIEVSERWRCPSAATLAPFVARGVPLLLSTDSHRRETIGRYDYALGVVRELAAA